MLKMIIVDDEFIILESLEKLIDWKSVGVTVVGTADNGAAAIDLTLKKRPDIILSDISMPFFSGLEMLDTLRKNDVAAEVIFISAYSKFEYALDALKNGAFDYILKPINENQLLETVKLCAEKILKSKSDPQFAGDWALSIEKRSSEYFSKTASLKLDSNVSFESIKRELLQSVKKADIDAANTRLLEFFMIMDQIGEVLDADIVKLRCVELLDFILRELEEYKLQDYLDNPQKALSAKKSITSSTSFDDVFSITRNLINNITQCVNEILSNGSKRLISLAITYIQENYKYDITLSQIAEHLYISPTYLSKIFSAEMQIPFSHYLLNYRIDMAKNLLRNTHLKIYEIASEVGYSDVAHFSKSFKHITGTTPIRYREHPYN